MIKKYVVLPVMLALVFSSFSLPANAEVKFKGLFQSWFSYAPQEDTDDSGYGFTIRRMRFKPYGSLGKNIKWTLQVGWDKRSPALIDAYLDFVLSKQFQVRIGQFSAPGTVSGSLTSSGSLDLIERPMVSQRWGGDSRLSGYRGFGVQAHGNLADGKVYYAFMVAHPKTSSLFNPSVKSSEYSHSDNGISLWGRLEAKPVKGMRLGAFAGSAKDDDDYVTNSYGAHFFYSKSGVNFKAEYIAGQFGPDGFEIKYNGFYTLLGYKTGKVEPIVRFDIYTPNDGSGDGSGVETYKNFTIGLNYFHTKSVKIQANYVIRNETMAGGLGQLDNNIFYICCQFSYK
jgi:hypothetical protein